MKAICTMLDLIKRTHLSIKLGFISRLYIVKSRKGIVFNKMSPTRPVKNTNQDWLVHYPGDLTTGIAINCILSVDHLYAVCQGPFPDELAHSFPPINLRYAGPVGFDCFYSFCEFQQPKLHHSSHLMKHCEWRLSNLCFYDMTPYLTIRNRQLHTLALEETNVLSVYKHLGRKIS